MEGGWTANKQEQVEDLTRKAKQVEYLIKALPEKEDAERSVSRSFILPPLRSSQLLTLFALLGMTVQNMRLQGIEAEMKVANEEYREAVKVAGEPRVSLFSSPSTFLETRVGV